MQRTLEIPGLEIHFQHTHQGGMRVTFKGQLSESFRHKDIPSPDTDPVTLDLEGVDFISSVGIREWVLLISEWTKNLRVFYEKCSICFIDQVNMVPDCLGRAQIISFYAPYYCTQCKKEMSSLIDVGVHHNALEQKKAPTVVCPCPQAQKLEFDALEDSYFSFCAS